MGKINAHIKAFFHHENYHGWFKRKRFFEGWYFKIVSSDGAHAFAIIPGIAMDTQGNKQAFIQVLDGKSCTAAYYPFLAEEFSPSEKKFKIGIADNSFSLNRIKLNLPGFTGKITFTEHVLWDKKLLAPGIMGWYAFVPFMECYHQVVSMHSVLVGKVQANGKEINFNGGKGYIEKDWGRSFPSSWVWMQSNHFKNKGTSFKISIAKIPWLGSSFIGFICAFLLEGKIYKFATYTGAKLKHLAITQNVVEIEIEDAKQAMSVYAKRPPGAELASPILGLMEGRVSESMFSEIRLIVRQKQTNTIVFDDCGKNACIEVAGNVNQLLTGYKK